MELLVGFIIFITWLLKKGVIYFGWGQCINTEGKYGCLIDFLSQISKLSNFNMLDLAYLMMHH